MGRIQLFWFTRIVQLVQQALQVLQPGGTILGPCVDLLTSHYQKETYLRQMVFTTIQVCNRTEKIGNSLMSTHIYTIISFPHIPTLMCTCKKSSSSMHMHVYRYIHWHTPGYPQIHAYHKAEKCHGRIFRNFALEQAFHECNNFAICVLIFLI